MKDYCVYWRHKHSGSISLEYVQSTDISYAIEQALEYISEVNQVDFEYIYICHVEVLE